MARDSGMTYSHESQTFSEPAAPANDGTTPDAPASGEPAQNDAPANSEGQTQDTTPVEGGGDEEPAAESETTEQQPGKNHVARKIDKLTRENAELRRAVAQVMQRQQAPQAPQAPAAPADPKPEAANYNDVAQFIADTAKWEARQTTRQALGQVFGQLAQQQVQQQQVQQAAAQVQEFNSRVETGAKEIKDFSQVTGANADVEVAPHVASALMQGIDNPALVLYHLAKNPGEVAKLNQMPMHKVAARLGAIEANAKRPAQISNAPKPGTPVTARGNIPSAISDDMDMESFVAARKRK